VPLLLAAEQFADTIRALPANNPRVKDVDLRSMIDASYIQNAVNKGLGAVP
jgi:hypothetical protein